MKLLSWKILPLVFFVALVIFFWKGLDLKPQELPSTNIGKKIPDFQLQALGTNVSDKVFSSKELRGKPILLNVWSSWCAACTEEQAFLLKLADSGQVIYGLNYKDQADSAMKWLKEWGNPYLLSGNDSDGLVGINLGVYGAPETFLLDKYGVIQYRHAGILNEEIWQQRFVPLLKQLEKA
jgi:cytochrome c biogenesis protein CcmG, thiol:disulfide interchange protein DsbE